MNRPADKQTVPPPNVFQNGDTVILRHLRESSPKMVVKGKVMAEDNETGKKSLDQVLVFWFNKLDDYCERPFNHLDLERIARAQDTGYRAGA